MATVPGWLLGRHLTAISIVGMTESTAGVLGAVATSSLSGYIDAVQYASRPVQEMIQSVDRVGAHYENTIEDSELQLVEILTRKGYHTPVLPTMAASYDYFTVTFTRGAQTYVSTMKRGAFTDGVANFGKNTVGLNMRPIDVSGSSSNPGYTGYGGANTTFTP